MQLTVLVSPSSPAATPCAVMASDLWFSQTPSLVEQAKQLCSTCPMAQSCLDAALTRREPWGVWGGELLERGVVVPRKRPMGRPRKADAELRRAERVQARESRRALTGLRHTA